MKIALCDNDLDFLKQTQKYIQQYLTSKKISFQTDIFLTGTEFLQSSTEYDIVFMDIYLETENGIAIAKQWRRKGNAQLVFICTSKEYALEAFELNACHYLQKPCSSETIYAAMERCLDRIGCLPKKLLEIKTKQGTFPILETSIIYIEVFDKTSVIHTDSQNITTRTSLDTLQEMLEPSIFIRIHRSYIINMNFIDTFCFDHVVLQNGLALALSRKRRTKLKEQYNRYLFSTARKEIL